MKIKKKGTPGPADFYEGKVWAETGGPQSGTWDIVDLEDHLCATHPGLQELRNQVTEAQEKYDAYLMMCKENR